MKNIIHKLNDLNKRSESHPLNRVDRDLYGLLCRLDTLQLAYDNLKSKPGSMTPGLNPETLDGISIEALEELRKRLKDESFQFRPGRRVQIPKASGGTRPLTVAPPRDKIVQEGTCRLFP